MSKAMDYIKTLPEEKKRDIYTKLKLINPNFWYQSSKEGYSEEEILENYLIGVIYSRAFIYKLAIPNFDAIVENMESIFTAITESVMWG